MGGVFSQFYFIPKPTLTEKNCPDQTGRVFIVTGGYAGVGFELCKILFAHNATVYIAGRSEPKASRAMSAIRAASPGSHGRLEFLQLDLSDPATIRPAVESFTKEQPRLDVLVNNAAVMYVPTGSTDAQGIELHMGTNCLGHYLLYQLLSPLLTKTAAASSPGTVRVCWAGSIAVHVDCPGPHGMVVDADGCPTEQGLNWNYGQTKVGNVFLARYFAKTTPESGVVHACFNPGNLRTDLQRHWKGLTHWLTDNTILYTPNYGAYTELWATLSPEITPAKSGAYVYPWGRLGSLPAGIEAAMEDEENGVAAKFLRWCGKKTESFM